ncbi:hypothetical protein BGZ51_009391 [Haplosporangium sp. Z 767]|nr:hypothetical protein BGZ51_009391 [Haplosporangium sp. Z 767]KAF9196049.1 hypothetical protein BGZ50_002306 [Haplosporangium sp. Z 11]
MTKEKLQDLVLEDFDDKESNPSIVDLNEYLQRKPPGFFISCLLSNVGRNEPRHGPRNYKDATCIMDLDQLRQHIQHIRAPNFDPMTPLLHKIPLTSTIYKTPRFVLRGTIRTDGFRLQLLTFKPKELNVVEYRRLQDDILPNRLTSTSGGVDYYLTEVRNIVKTSLDVANLWGCAAGQIKILGLDLGQARVVGASALLLKRHDPNRKKPEPQKAVYQPTFKHRRWMQDQKGITPGDGMRSISDIETGLPSLRGKGAPFANYVEQVKGVKGQLDGFYNGNNRLKKHK